MKYSDISKEISPFFKLDERLAKDVSNYVKTFIGSNNRLDFFSSSLLGVYPIVMTEGDVSNFLSLFNISRPIITGFTVKISDIDKNFRVQRDSLNVFVGSLLHLIENSKVRDKEQFQKDVIFFMVMRIFTSRYNHDFKSLRTVEESKRVYNSLSNAFDIKKYKTNLGVIKYKIDSIYTKNYHSFKKNKTNTYARFAIDVRGKTTSYINGWWSAYNEL